MIDNYEAKETLLSSSDNGTAQNAKCRDLSQAKVSMGT